MPRYVSSRGRAFTLVELLVVIAIIALLVAVLLPSLKNARNTAKQSLNFSNLKNFGTSTQSYSADFQDRVWAFTWRGAVPPTNRVNYTTTYADLATTGNDVTAAAFQASDIIRRRAQPQWQGVNGASFPRWTNWIPHVYYSHLVLMDYLAARLPEPMIHSPFDKIRATWQGAVYEPTPEAAYARYLAPHGREQRWLYSSSYETVPSSYTPFKESPDGGFLRQNGTQWGVYLYNNTQGYRLGQRKLGDIAFASQKVHMFENANRMARKEMIFLEKACDVSVVTFDGRVSTVKNGEFNLGGYLRPNNQIMRQSILYPRGGAPEVGYPATFNGQDILEPSRCRWTVGGLKGIDFGAKEPF
jgi:prepilin-type N-terminal cleavage/methylation domain-containing protein